MDLKELRVSAGLTQKEVAKALGVGRTAVTMWELGYSTPRSEVLLTLAALYNCTVDDLLTDKPA